MSSIRVGRLAWGLAGLAVTLVIADFAVSLATGLFGLRGTVVLVYAIGVAFSIVGALVASRHPRNSIGWIFLGVAVSTGLSGLAHTLVKYRLQRDTGTDPGMLAGVAAAYSDVAWIPFVLVPATVLLLLFPDGRLPSRRWRFVAWCAATGILGSLFTGITVTRISDFPTVANPLAIDGGLMDVLTALSALLAIVGILGSAASLIVRFRRAGRVRRQQIKWLATAGALVAVTFPIALTLYDVVGAGVANTMIMLTVLGLPVAAGVAILRHRLYDIDVVINRALVYGSLTATLAGTYIGSVLLLQLVLSGLTAGNGLAVAGSTLAVAAFFQPARRRIQAGVDRRFFRRRYDAARTLATFGAHLRDQVDLDALGEDLRGVVSETMQPQHVSLWLRAR